EYFVKQAHRWNYQGRASIEREARLYRFAQTHACPAPGCYHWDPVNSILILESIGGDSALCNRGDTFSTELARHAGKVVGGFHRAMQHEETRAAFPAEVSFFTLHDGDDEADDDFSGGQRELIRAVRRHADFSRALNALRAEWRRDTVIHGDLKLEHCFLSADGARLRLIDWEFIGEGDSCWDAGGMLQSWCLFWARWPEEYNVEDFRPALRAFVAGW